MRIIKLWMTILASAQKVDATNYIRKTQDTDSIEEEEIAKPEEDRAVTPGDLYPYPESENFIVGGAVSSTAPPWMVFPDNPTDRRCGGSLVSPDVVVTAAHCYNDCNDPFFDCAEPCPTRVRIGSIIRYEGGEVLDVLPYSCVIHPDFVINPNRFDVAVYRLAKPVVLDNYAVINANPNFPSFQYSGEASSQNRNNFTAYGFGRFSNNANSGSERLRVLNTTYWWNCAAYQGGGAYDASHHVCTWNPNADEGICRGDSGGPLIFTDPTNNIEFLVGIASFLGSNDEEAPCATGAMDYFTRVGTYANWINLQINSAQSSSCSWRTEVWNGLSRIGSFFQGWF